MWTALRATLEGLGDCKMRCRWSRNKKTGPWCYLSQPRQGHISCSTVKMLRIQNGGGGEGGGKSLFWTSEKQTYTLLTCHRSKDWKQAQATFKGILECIGTDNDQFLPRCSEPTTKAVEQGLFALSFLWWANCLKRSSSVPREAICTLLMNAAACTPPVHTEQGRLSLLIYNHSCSVPGMGCQWKTML